MKCRIQEVWQEEEVDDALKEGCSVSSYIRRGRRQRQELVRIYMDVWAARARKTEHWDLYKERRSMEFYLEDIRRWRSSPCTKIQLSTITLNRRILCCAVLVLQDCSTSVRCCVLPYSARSNLPHKTHIKRHENEEPLNSGQEIVYHGTLGYQPPLTGNSDRISSFQIDQPAHTNHVVPPMRNNNTPAVTAPAPIRSAVVISRLEI